MGNSDVTLVTFVVGERGGASGVDIGFRAVELVEWILTDDATQRFEHFVFDTGRQRRHCRSNWRQIPARFTLQTVSNDIHYSSSSTVAKQLS